MAQKKSERRVSHPFQDVSRGRTTRQYQKPVIIFLVLSIAIVGLIMGGLPFVAKGKLKEKLEGTYVSEEKINPS